MKKSPYSYVNLRVTWHGDEFCELGDELVTRTGRRYQILQISGKKFSCMVLPDSASVQSRQWQLTWNKKGRMS